MKRLLVVVALLVAVALSFPLWKPIANKSKWYLVGSNIYHDSLRRWNIRQDQIGGEPQAAFTPRQLQLINDTFDHYLKYSSLTREGLKGQKVLEIGPGDSVGVALKFLAAGASEVTCIDKFVHYQESPAHLQLYRAIREGLSAEDKERFDQVIKLDNGIKLDTNRLKWVYGKGFEDTDSLFAPESFNVIVSAAVLEEIYDTDLAFQKMDRLLAPGGYAIHKIDLRDYEMFHKHGFHRLEFLTIPDTLYRYMSQSSGQPNRRLANYYRDKMAELGYDATIHVAVVAGGDDMPEYKLKPVKGVDYTEEALQSYQAMRPKLLPRYQTLSDDDLITESILLAARKPVRKASASR